MQFIFLPKKKKTEATYAWLLLYCPLLNAAKAVGRENRKTTDIHPGVPTTLLEKSVTTCRIVQVGPPNSTQKNRSGNSHLTRLHSSSVYEVEREKLFCYKP